MTSFGYDAIPQDPLEASFGKPAQLAFSRAADDSDAPVHEMRGQLTRPIDVLQYMLAGKAVMTLVSKKTGTRYTFRFSRPDPQKVLPGRRRPVWVSLLNGADNTADYTFLGTVWEQAPVLTFNRSAKSRVADDAPSMKALRWFLRELNLGGESLLNQAEVWHEGRCGRCGRKLTVPSSIESGFGPDCINYV